MLEARPAVASFVFGVPSDEVVEGARARGIRLVGTATSVDEAVALEASGVDAIVATGLEAGGHRVSFLRQPEQSLIGSISLIPQVVDAVSVPVIAAGGIADRRGVAAALALGAAGVQVGTAFLRTRQSATNDAHRAAIGATAAHETVLTRAMSGRLARGARNRVVREIEAGGVIAPFPVQNWMTGKFRAEAIRQGRADLQSLWMGQSAPLAVHDDVRDVYAELAAGLPALSCRADLPRYLPRQPSRRVRRADAEPSRASSRRMASRPHHVVTSTLCCSESASVHHSGAFESSAMRPPAAIAAAMRASTWSCGTQTSTWIRPRPSVTPSAGAGRTTVATQRIHQVRVVRGT